MRSAKNISATKVAILLCTHPVMKKEILCIPGSYYELNKANYKYDRKELWNRIIEHNVTAILENLNLEDQLQQTIIGTVLLCGMGMLTWAEYHEKNLGIPREFSVEFLNKSFFTDAGIIDNVKTAEELIKCSKLSIQQKYRLACLNCFTDRIPRLNRQMTKDEKKLFYCEETPEEIFQPDLVKFWSYHLMGETEKLIGENSLNQYRLEKAAQSGHKAAVLYCLDKTKLRRKKSAVIDAALQAVQSWAKANDWVIFRDEDHDTNYWWIPEGWLQDIVYTLLLRMDENQRVEFLRKDIENAECAKHLFYNRSRVLELLLDWPFQHSFMKMATLLWGILPMRSYNVLLLTMKDKFEPSMNSIKYGEEKSFDYRRLLREFWIQCPEDYKEICLNDKVVAQDGCDGFRFNEGKELVVKLFTLKNFTEKDREIINLILDGATFKEKMNVIASQTGKDIISRLMREEKWEILTEFVSKCFPSEVELNEFKKKLAHEDKEGVRVWFDLVSNDRWDAAESYIAWIGLNENEIGELKIQMINSTEAKIACRFLALYNEGVEIADKIVNFCLSSEAEITQFKRSLIYSDTEMSCCAMLVVEDELGLVDQYAKWCLQSEEEMDEFKEGFEFKKGDFIFEHLMPHYSDGFEAGKWVEMEKFLTWCFSCQDEISEFKMKYFEKSHEIHLNVIEVNRWDEAETLFAWLELPDEEIKQFKKATLLDYSAASDMFIDLLGSEDGDERFIDYGSKEEAIELLLRWYLTYKEAVTEFKDKFEHIVDFESFMIGNSINLDFLIQRLLKDLSGEQHPDDVQFEQHSHGIEVDKNGDDKQVEKYSSNMEVDKNADDIQVEKYTSDLKVEQYSNDIQVDKHPDKTEVEQCSDTLKCTQVHDDTQAKEHDSDIEAEHRPNVLQGAQTQDDTGKKGHTSDIEVEKHPNYLEQEQQYVREVEKHSCDIEVDKDPNVEVERPGLKRKSETLSPSKRFCDTDPVVEM